MTPRNTFLLDALGAVISIIFLGIILVRLQELVGMPIRTLYILACIPIIFLIYDLYSLTQPIQKQKKLLKGIALLNFGYCIISAYYIIIECEQLTVLGWVYFIVEIIILIGIISLEVKISNQISTISS